jgi:hypothetical protein
MGSRRLNWAALGRAPAWLVFLLSLPLALLIDRLTLAFAANAERGVMAVGVVFALAILLQAAIYALPRLDSRAALKASPAQTAVLVVAMLAVCLSAVYLFQAAQQALYPGDFLIWSESDFVNDILKLRIGYPLYSDQLNNDSFNYPPGSQLLSFALAALSGNPDSIPAYRAAQILFTLLSAFVALACAWRLAELALPERRLAQRGLWAVLWLPFLFLAASNSITNPFVNLLHNDSLAQLVSAASFYLLLRYAATRRPVYLFWLAITPTAGFWVKQSVAIWAAIVAGYLFLFDPPRNWRRLVGYGAAAFGLLGITLAAALAIYGDNFTYWVITVLGQHGVSPLRSLQNFLQSWPYVALGLAAGLALLRGRRFGRLAGLWLVSFGLLILEIYTSGVAWMLNHIGPGSLLAAVWFCVALPRWIDLQDAPQGDDSPPALPALIAGLWRGKLPPHRLWLPWLRAGLSAALLALSFQALGMVRIPTNPITPDHYRYFQAIEAEFAGLPSDQVLLDAGSWMYLHDRVVMKDRAPSIGERGYSQTGDFSAMVDRLRSKTYRRIILRNYTVGDFWYDHAGWGQSSGIRQALDENYVEVRRIPAVQGGQGYLLQTISVLEPRTP